MGFAIGWHLAPLKIILLFYSLTYSSVILSSLERENRMTAQYLSRTGTHVPSIWKPWLGRDATCLKSLPWLPKAASMPSFFF